MSTGSRALLRGEGDGLVAGHASWPSWASTAARCWRARPTAGPVAGGPTRRPAPDRRAGTIRSRAVGAAAAKPSTRWRWVRMAATGSPPVPLPETEPAPAAAGWRCRRRWRTARTAVTGWMIGLPCERAEQGLDEGRVVGPGGRGHGHHGPGGVVVGLLVVDLGQLGHQLVGGEHRVAGRSGEPGRQARRRRRSSSGPGAGGQGERLGRRPVGG